MRGVRSLLVVVAFATAVLALPPTAAVASTVPNAFGFALLDNTLQVFHLASPGTILGSVPITGVGVDLVLAIDVRPATSEL